MAVVPFLPSKPSAQRLTCTFYHSSCDSCLQACSAQRCCCPWACRRTWLSLRGVFLSRGARSVPCKCLKRGGGNVLERGEGYRQTDTDTDTDRHPHPPTQTHVSVQTRPTMIKYGYSNIRDLIGPKVCQRPAAPSHFTHIVVPFHPPLPSFRSLLHGCPFAQVNLQAAKEKPVVRLQ